MSYLDAVTALAILVLGTASLQPYPFEGFTVSLPSKPTLLEIAGAPKGVKTWVLRTPGGTALTVVFADHQPVQAADKTLAELTAGFLNSTHAALTAQKDVLLNGWQGLETAMTVRQSFSWGRNYAFPGGFFGVVGSGGKASKSLVDAVLASIVFDPKLGDGPDKVAGPAWKRQAVTAPYSLEFPGAVEKKSTGTAGASEGWASDFGSRRYVAFITTFPKDLPALGAEGLAEAVRTANSSGLASTHGKLLSRKAGTLLGRPSEVMEILTEDEKSIVRFEASATQSDLVILVVAVPTCLRGSEEVSRFVSSIQIEHPKE